VNGSARATPAALLELAAVFLRLGSTAFGGPAVHIALLQDELVRRRKWLSEAHFLDLLSATNLIPGPNSTELALHIGAERAGWPGLLVAGTAFIVPAMLITAACGHAYLRYGTLPSARWLLYGIKPVMLAVVVQAIWRLAPGAIKSKPLALLAGLGVLLGALGVHELWLLFGAGALVAGVRSRRGGEGSHAPPALAAWLGAGLGATSLMPGLSLPWLFWTFFKTGSVLFGSGYVLLAFLRADLVERLHWLSEAQLLDAIAVGQITPGPVFTTATFIGYLLAGPSGACVATAGIFLPAFLFVAISRPLLARLRSSEQAAAFLDGVNVASLALMALVTLQLARAALIDLPSAALALLSALLLLRFSLNPTWLLCGGAATGWLVHQLGFASP
jgi:chromate transporter